MSEIFYSFLRSWKSNFQVQFTTFIVLVGTYSVIAIFALAYQNLNHILSQWGENVQMTAFLNDSATIETLNKTREYISGKNEVKNVDYISKEQAVSTFLNQMGSFAPDLISDKDFGNPLPASFEIKLENTLSRASAFKDLVALADYVKDLPGVDDVSYGQGWVENYSNLVQKFGQSSWGIIFILVCGSLLIVGNAIRNSVFAQRDEVEVMELVGATQSRIQLPFIVEGAFLGLASAVVAVFVSLFVYLWQSSVFNQDLSFLGLSGSLYFLSPLSIAMFILLGGGIGAFGAYLCVRKLSTGWAAAERLSC